MNYPDNWQYLSIKECCSVVSGSTPKRNKPEYWDGEIDWVTPKDLSNLNIPVLEEAPEKITKLGYKSCSTTLLPQGSILFSSRAPIGLVAIAGKEMCTNQGFKSLVPDQSVDSSYLYWCIRYFTPQLAAQGSGTTFKELSKTIVEKFKIPLPPLEEQKRIAAILDKADAIRQKRKEAIALTEELLRSTFLDMFGDPVTNPKGWKVDELGKYISHSNNGLSRRRKTLENKGHIVLRLQDVRESYIVFDEPNRIALDEKEKQRYLLEAGDLLFIRVNGNKEYVGRCAVFKGFNEDVYHNDHLIRIQSKPEIESDYLAFVFNHSSGKKLLKNKIKTSAGQYTVSQQGIESIKMPIPPHDLQVKYVQRSQLLKNQRDKYLLLLENSETLFNSLLQKAFRGEL